MTTTPDILGHFAPWMCRMVGSFRCQTLQSGIVSFSLLSWTPYVLHTLFGMLFEVCSTSTYLLDSAGKAGCMSSHTISKLLFQEFNHDSMLDSRPLLTPTAAYLRIFSLATSGVKLRVACCQWLVASRKNSRILEFLKQTSVVRHTMIL